MTYAIELSERLDALTAERESLSRNLREAADRIEAGDVIDPETLTSAVSGYRSRFRDLSMSAGVLDDKSSHNLEHLTLGAVEARVSQLSVLEPASEVLKMVSSLQRVDKATSPALESIRTSANELLARLQVDSSRNDSPISTTDLEDANQLANSRHIFNHLVSLVTDPTAMSDDLWNEYVESIRSRFGSELTTAIIRGRLELSATESIH